MPQEEPPTQAEHEAPVAEAEYEEAPTGFDPRGGDEDVYVEPAPELGSLHKDYILPGVESDETNPYRWHTGQKRDHGGEDAIESIDVVKQFGRMRIQNGLNLGVPDDMISMQIGRAHV